ncbi:MAG: aminotransferase class I/II-fold pyridoxal phosphate-dependent enzyme [Muribaculaceae bacterium]|nr:aminotransferase class I/II-fold pyridoxal phosphate-dependent enzyme [Muribaculaceae bacterium]
MQNLNIKPSDRISDVKEYYFSQKLRQIASMKASGIDVISLGVGGPDLPPPDDVVETLCEAVRDPANHGYQPHVGIAPLRQAFARWYKREYGVTLDPETEILPLIGSKEGVTHISLAFLNSGDKVLVPNPGYPTYTSISRMVGATPVFYDLDEQHEWQPDFDALERMDLSGVKLMWLNYPHMPTGAPAKRETFEKVIAFGRRHGIVIVHDNPYSFILNPEPMSILSVSGAMDIAIELNSLSKSHNMPGWRVGVAVGNPTFLSWILRIKSNIDSGQFKPVMLAAAKALTQGEEWHRSLNTHYATRRKVAEKIMEALGCSYDPSQTGLFLWGRINDPSITSEQLADRVLEEARVFITPGFIFGSNGERYIRLSLCAPVERLNEALDRINQTINKNI